MHMGTETTPIANTLPLAIREKAEELATLHGRPFFDMDLDVKYVS